MGDIISESYLDYMRKARKDNQRNQKILGEWEGFVDKFPDQLVLAYGAVGLREFLQIAPISWDSALKFTIEDKDDARGVLGLRFIYDSALCKPETILHITRRDVDSLTGGSGNVTYLTDNILLIEALLERAIVGFGRLAHPLTSIPLAITAELKRHGWKCHTCITHNSSLKFTTYWYLPKHPDFYELGVVYDLTFLDRDRKLQNLLGI